MDTKTRFVFLMHPKEYKREKAGTGRLTHLALGRSELHVGVAFDGHEAVQSLISDPRSHVVLLYPGPSAVNLSSSGCDAPAPPGKELTVLLLDATWSCARKMLKLSPSLQRLPRLMFTPSAPSRFVIKQQPQAGCLSTLESVHELLLVLTRRGLDHYDDPDQLLSIFQSMQDYQIQCAADSSKGGYRRQAYGRPSDRYPATTSRRRRYLSIVSPATDSQAIDSNSTSNTSVESGGIAPG